LINSFKAFATEYKQLERKDEKTVELEINELMKDLPNTIKKLGPFINEVKSNLDQIKTPTMVVQARKDELINADSATYIYDHIASEQKEMNWYEDSGHVITLGKEREQLHEDIYAFLESLNWEE